MATEKTKRSVAAGVHVLAYSLPFLFLRPSMAAWLVIVTTHFAIDRWRLARYVVWVKNLPLTPPWRECTATGYPPDRPAWMAVWLLIIADNVLHVVINGLALRYL